MSNLKNTFILATAVSTLSACGLMDNSTTQNNSSEQNIETVIEANKVATFARYVPERNDDFAWENDLVAFRAYGPFAREFAENAGVDCWLKRVKTPIVNKWYKQALEQDMTYHKDWGEGLDNYHVGSSAGCGSSALWLNGKREPLETYTQWEILEQSPEKTRFVLSYKRVIADVEYQEKKEIEIKLGQRVFKATSTFWKNGELAINLPISVGLTTHDEAAIANWDKLTGTVSTWEVIEGSGLGTGVVLDPKRVDEYKLIPSLGQKDVGHVLAITKTDNKGQVTYYAGYGWEKAKEITTFAQWKQYLKVFYLEESGFKR
ncbi:DUF4861 family protein [Colwellia sp. UCD-KL20]|uniref:DUF4861 family protein n=1 Tax=Colwellia sp. UCD-KL20 TaxID=1917165 RepID=UPI002570CB8F|nr:DUF4861 family protein [Colwellia sp. UCD-KL20]